MWRTITRSEDDGWGLEDNLQENDSVWKNTNCIECNLVDGVVLEDNLEGMALEGQAGKDNESV